jgi:hypothetical protein
MFVILLVILILNIFFLAGCYLAEEKAVNVCVSVYLNGHLFLLLDERRFFI